MTRANGKEKEFTSHIIQLSGKTNRPRNFVLCMMPQQERVALPSLGRAYWTSYFRFRLHNVALVNDVEKAFLMILVADCDWDILQFLWIKDLEQSQAQIVAMRFTHVIFGVSSSPFLPNATIDHQMKSFYPADESFVEKFCHSIYVDDLTTRFSDVSSAY